ncbi:ArsR/SmtB family transcription factor [Mycolicibacterium thermoresistibile]|jgi:DNA-binding transcriptional ArsR family regulator|uniref:Transcriptional regulator, arsr family protein n=2 Tax=Mycolicibacterium thermoresistibile TaxID=1797 RepID=G7CEP5_MYCT3|nr:metalloregulator ArsR/SmtB family transcription factor [Mycolicibacterium thermoresistibile]EHI13587.1 transcriptional regulator, arsr family protein [Mycolicibacterium thermoresistibile ATCC 19527]MCV7189274.1 winged helix-turn-helix transcriptional regulator [Mycolicibacterium thermoresistibile]GAT16601.1 arsR family transcriptional regulator [Mycolicibacterium thermoresistibile]SNW17712.1 putative transcriptional regulator [Mycolicibacterium thermoresistibile]
MTATDQLHPVFHALGDPNRMRLITRLCDAGPGSTSQVAQAVSVSRQAATKHLLILEEAGLVRSDRRGRERIWRMQPEALDDASEYLDRLARRWDRALGRLRAFVEAPEQPDPGMSE